MKCPSCGRECVDESNFCFYCGYSFRGVASTDDSLTNLIQQEKIREENQVPEQSMKTWQWTVYFLLLMIPYTWIVWLILTCVWAFGDKGSLERKTFAKGMLLAVVILLTLVVIVVIVMINTYGLDGLTDLATGGVYKTFEEYMNGVGGAVK